VGFNPFRPQRRSAVDYVMVAAAMVACLLLVLWAAGVV
jgi:ferric-dicitrate binding protein FerR (iron transport regulator)